MLERGPVLPGVWPTIALNASMNPAGLAHPQAVAVSSATTGSVPFKSFAELTTEDYLAGLQDKALGQISLVLSGLPQLTDGGSFTP